MKIKLFQILEYIVLRKSKKLQYYSNWGKDNKVVGIKEKGQIQTKLI